VLPEVSKVRKDQIYPRHLLVREGHAGVHEQDTASSPHRRHVLADLVKPAQGHDLQGVVA
jgi:hypothetical protein